VDMFTPPRRTLLEHADTKGAGPPKGQA
jgi:hypothetical protein